MSTDTAKKPTELEQLYQKIYEQLDYMDKNYRRLKNLADKVMDDSSPVEKEDNTPTSPISPYSPGILAGINGLFVRMNSLNVLNDTQLSKLENLI